MQNHSYEKDLDLHENESACRTHFHMKGFALRLVFKQRQKRTRLHPAVTSENNSGEANTPMAQTLSAYEAKNFLHII